MAKIGYLNIFPIHLKLINFSARSKILTMLKLAETRRRKEPLLLQNHLLWFNRQFIFIELNLKDTCLMSL